MLVFVKASFLVLLFSYSAVMVRSLVSDEDICNITIDVVDPAFYSKCDRFADCGDNINWHFNLHFSFKTVAWGSK